LLGTHRVICRIVSSSMRQARPGSPSSFSAPGCARRDDAYLFALGVVACAFVLLPLVAAATVALTRRATWVSIAVRAVGSWVAAIGLMVAVV
jgi:hypothetical protein